MREQRELTEREQVFGLTTLDLISDWSDWVHRRVETFAFEDAVTIRRSVSVDFTVPERMRTPVPLLRDTTVYAIPLGLLRKRRLRHFDLRDESGRALPLLTSSKNGAIATAVLGKAAETVTGHAVPDGVTGELWQIGNGTVAEAIEAWEGLARRRSEAEETRSYRETLVRDADFMALASDLARNFLVLALLPVAPGERRIIKFAYAEPRPARTRARKWARTTNAGLKLRGFPQTVKGALGDREVSMDPDTKCVGTLRVEAFTERTDDDGGKPVGRKAEAELRVMVESVQGAPFARTLVTDKQGKCLEQLPCGRYRVTEVVPRGLLELQNRSQELEITEGQVASVRYQHQQIGPLSLKHALDAELPPAKPGRRLRQFLGWWPERLAILVPAIGQASSYHLELLAPEDLQFTKCRLTDSPSHYSSANEKPDPDAVFDIELKSQQRAHLHRGDVEQNRVGLAVAHMRSRPEALLRVATVSSVVAALLLAVVAQDLTTAASNVGPTATVLFFLPGALIGYAIRPREDPAATAALTGLRVIASVPGLCALAGALLLLLGSDRVPTSPPGGPPEVELSAGMHEAFVVLVVIAIVAALSLARAWAGAVWPAEQRKGAGSRR